MRRFSAQYIITSTGSILKRGIISTDDNGLIISVEDTGGDIRELSSLEFYNGIIVPGFVNCHTHLELANMLGEIPKHTGLGKFITEVRYKRNNSNTETLKAIEASDRRMHKEGTSAVADICNTAVSFETKQNSKISYVNFLEIFGLIPSNEQQAIDEILKLLHLAKKANLQSYIVPHSVYSLSKSLFKKLYELIKSNDLVSIHYLESMQEKELLQNLSGAIMDTFANIGISPALLVDRVSRHIDAINNYISPISKLFLVHNTFATETDISTLCKRDNTWWCLCPNANMYIENKLPPIDLLIKHNANIVLGTDSLASNTSLNLLDELITLQTNFASLKLNDIIPWASKNGAEALALSSLGTIEKGKSPGLVLIENCDLNKLRLTKQSASRRLI